MTAKNLIAAGAAIMLVVANFFLISVGLLGSGYAQITTLALWVMMMIAGVLLGHKWLIYGAQTVVSALLLWRIVQYGLMGLNQQPGANQYSSFVVIAIIILTYYLAWLCTRAIVPRTAE